MWALACRPQAGQRQGEGKAIECRFEGDVRDAIRSEAVCAGRIIMSAREGEGGRVGAVRVHTRELDSEIEGPC